MTRGNKIGIKIGIKMGNKWVTKKNSSKKVYFRAVFSGTDETRTRDLLSDSQAF